MTKGITYKYLDTSRGHEDTFYPSVSSLFFFMNFAICRLMTCLPLLWKNDQVDRKERIGCNCNVRFVTMRKKLNPTFSVRDLGFFLHRGRNLSFKSHQNNAKIQKFDAKFFKKNYIEKHLNFHAKIMYRGHMKKNIRFFAHCGAFFEG